MVTIRPRNIEGVAIPNSRPTPTPKVEVELSRVGPVRDVVFATSKWFLEVATSWLRQHPYRRCAAFFRAISRSFC
jgi:hypothetical protein